MDSQTKVNVEFKPAKRMKKRRELDALVNGKQTPSYRSNGRMMRNGKHELLRNDSDSSEVEEFILPEKSLVRNRRGHSAICSVCITVCWGVLLVVCLVGIGSLVWMCIQLKKDVDQLRNQLDKVGLQNNNLPGEVRDILTEQEKMSNQVHLLESGDQGIDRLRENFTQLIRQVLELEITTKSLSQSVANMPQLVLIQSLPQQVKDLSKSVADLGSNLQTTEQSLVQLQEAKVQAEHQLADFEARLQSIQLSTNNQKSTDDKDSPGSRNLSANDVTKLDSLAKDLNSVNTSVYAQLEDFRGKCNSQQVSLQELFNYTVLLNTRVTFLEVKPTSLSTTPSEATSLTAVQTLIEELKNVSREQEATIQRNKVETDKTVLLLEAQVTGHEIKLAGLSDRINKVGASVTELDNMTGLNFVTLNSKVQLLSEKLKVSDLEPHLNSGEKDVLLSLNNSTSNADLTSTTTTSSSSTSSLFSSSSPTLSSVDRGNRNPNEMNGISDKSTSVN